jgi:hypothetical protein
MAPASPLPAPRPVRSGTRLSRRTSIQKLGWSETHIRAPANACQAARTEFLGRRSGLFDVRQNPGVDDAEASTISRSPKATGRNSDSSSCSVRPSPSGSTRSQALILVRVSTTRRITLVQHAIVCLCSCHEYSPDQLQCHQPGWQRLLAGCTVAVPGKTKGLAYARPDQSHLTWLQLYLNASCNAVPAV